MKQLTQNDLWEPFFIPPTREQKIGIEVEIASLDPNSGISLPYEGPVGIKSILERLHQDIGGELLLDRDNLVGIDLPNGSGISLENGGAIEFQSAPNKDLVSLKNESDGILLSLAEAGRSVGAALVPGANFPFNNLDQIHWMPKTYGLLLREYFQTLGEQGSMGDVVMAHITSTQATLDYLSEQEAIQMLQTGIVLTPIVVALFANSPLEAGRVCGVLSRRTQYFFKSDPQRFGFVPPALRDDLKLQDFIDWALEFPMIYRKQEKGEIEPVRCQFKQLLESGFKDGSYPTLKDWKQHLSQIYVDVRLRKTIELRAADGPSYPYIFTIPAFWTGLLYYEPARLAVWEMLKGLSLAEMQQAREDAAIQGLKGYYGKEPIVNLAKEVVSWAKKGLEDRIKKGLEAQEALSLLSPIEEISTTGKTFAETCIEMWEGELGKSPSRYVDHFRI
ncbi:MAG: glutamate-cysteine ligase family protein [Calothrix sp. MO_192.B10]|nr:glutamate-cysteine ligase family protein [Calothrix sp. MO_192.B10]